MIYLFFLGVSILVCAVYAVVVLLEVPGMAEERLGKREKIPLESGEWKTETNTEQARAAGLQGLICETRLWIDTTDGFFPRQKIYRQVRYLDPETKKIIRTEKDVRIRRRRTMKK